MECEILHKYEVLPLIKTNQLLIKFNLLVIPKKVQLVYLKKSWTYVQDLFIILKKNCYQGSNFNSSRHKNLNPEFDTPNQELVNSSMKYEHDIAPLRLKT
jgi:hypothetical protein